ncbi:hypothetical protein [Naasia lichenicola]|uniref:Prepilin-type N-terminal cleavage/methylation domain-containing protein n=1 Tax=Naasia lichenicola TaxID=2565933 RepID=A0A4S4FH95_9MICO|nr:hypothetical protein [Naasia lichenicola]THG29653.1 hypothetical protein E6C64_13360 [Naasia lichenicola]
MSRPVSITARIRARLRHASHDDAGISLSELIITMMVASIVLTIASSMFVTIAQSTTASNQARDAATVAGTASNSIGRAIRSAVQVTKPDGKLAAAVVAGTASSVTLTTLVMPASSTTLSPVQIRYTIVNGALIEETWTGSNSTGFWVFTGAATRTKSLGSTIVLPTGSDAPIFSYLDGNGAPMTIAASGLTDAQRKDVSSIDLTLRVRSSSSTKAKPIIIDTTIGMPNLGYSGDDS